MPLICTPENFRAEFARFKLTRESLCRHIGMHRNTFSMFMNGVRPLQGWAAHNIGLAFNIETGKKLFDVDESVGLRKGRAGRKPGYRPATFKGRPRG